MLRGALVLVASLMPACGYKTPSCNAPQQCIYNEQDDAICRQSCVPDAGSCPSGEACTGEAACCENVPGNECSSPPAFVCCPASGC
jgi:hypothetical protein